MLCKLGATDEELARVLGVNEATLCRWQKAHPELRKAIRASKLVADIKVATKLYDLATGFEYEEAQAIKLKEVKYGPKKASERDVVDLAELAAEPLPLDQAGESHQLVAHVDDLIEPRPKQVVLSSRLLAWPHGYRPRQKMFRDGIMVRGGWESGAYEFARKSAFGR
jgi:hypothetical protein